MRDATTNVWASAATPDDADRLIEGVFGAPTVRSRARRDRTEAAVDVCAVIASFLAVVVLRITVRIA
jgi:hypothetical protein